MSKWFEIDRDADGVEFLTTSLRGTQLLENPMLNKGSAFTEQERRDFGLTGLLPPGVSTLEVQLDRIYGNYRQKTSNLERYIHLVSLTKGAMRMVMTRVFPVPAPARTSMGPCRC